MSGQRLAFNVQRTGSLRGRASSRGPGQILLVEEGLVSSLSPAAQTEATKQQRPAWKPREEST